MAKKAKLPTDVNSRAKAIVDFATSDEELPDPDKGKDPAAVAAGRKGGSVGGDARAEALTATRRAEIARAAAEARWSRARRTQ
jgi:hypothetical protein